MASIWAHIQAITLHSAKIRRMLFSTSNFEEKNCPLELNQGYKWVIDSSNL